MRSPTARSESTQRVADLVGRTLFGAPEPPALRGPRRVALLAGIGVAAFVVILFRIPPSSWNTPWAEDGWVFLAQALRDGPAAIPEPFAGYLHLVPRLAASVAVLAPLEVAPLVLALLTAALTAALTVALYLFAEQLIASPFIRGAVVVSFAALPMATAEVSLSIANLHWYLMAVAVWAFLAPGRSRATVVVAAIVIAAAVTSDPLTLLFAPLVIPRLIGQVPGSRVLAVTTGVAAVVQIAAVVAARFGAEPRRFSDERPSATELGDAFAGHVALPTFGGVRGSQWLLEHLGAGVGLAAAAVALLLLAVGLLTSRRRLAILVFALGALGFFATVCILQWDALDPLGTALEHGARYMMVPILLLLGAVAMTVDGLRERLPRLAAVALATAFLLGVSASAVIDYRGWDFRAGVLSWPDALDEAAKTDCRSNGDVANPQIAPDWFQRPEISCRLLENR
jgi:hypothetical protein